MRIGLLAAVLFWSLQLRAELPYWICTTESGSRAVQDQPCANDPDAPPNGQIADENEPEKQRPEASRDEVTADPLGIWRNQWRRFVEKLDRVGAGLEGKVPSLAPLVDSLKRPWLWLGLCALIALWLLVRLSRRLLWSFRNWRYRRRPSAWTEHYAQRPVESKSVRADISTGKKARKVPSVEQAVSVTAEIEAPAVVGDSASILGPDRFSPALLQGLEAAQFGEMCVRLWRMRGLRAAYDPDKDLSKHTLILLQRPAEPRKPYGIAMCMCSPKDALGAETVNELIRLMKLRRCEYGAIMTPGEFSAEARDQVRGKNIELKGSITLMIELESLSDRQRKNLLAVVTSEPEDEKFIEPPIEAKVRKEPTL